MGAAKEADRVLKECVAANEEDRCGSNGNVAVRIGLGKLPIGVNGLLALTEPFTAIERPLIPSVVTLGFGFCIGGTDTVAVFVGLVTIVL